MAVGASCGRAPGTTRRVRSARLARSAPACGGRLAARCRPRGRRGAVRHGVRPHRFVSSRLSDACQTGSRADPSDIKGGSYSGSHTVNVCSRGFNSDPSLCPIGCRRPGAPPRSRAAWRATHEGAPPNAAIVRHNRGRRHALSPILLIHDARDARGARPRRGPFATPRDACEHARTAAIAIAPLTPCGQTSRRTSGRSRGSCPRPPGRGPPGRTWGTRSSGARGPWPAGPRAWRPSRRRRPPS